MTQEVKPFDTNMERRLLQNQGIMKGDKDTKGNGCTERERERERRADPLVWEDQETRP